ncbi:Mov34/MPN/PAD-1 family protein [Burkholderia cenocepacia]
MKGRGLRFRLPGATWTLQLGAMALDVLLSHTQQSSSSKESVGQLFARDLTVDPVQIELATVLRPKRASWARVTFDTTQAAAEREHLFEKGLHCVGIWHTHPEPSPVPSLDDRSLARNHALAAKPQLSGIVFAIVGTAPVPASVRIWVDDGVDFNEAVLDKH